MVGVDQASGKRLVYLRPLNSLSAQTVRGTERAIHPFWSATAARWDSSPTAGSRRWTWPPARSRMCAAPQLRAGAWHLGRRHNRLPEEPQDPLHRVSASGGTCVPATPFDAEKEIAQSVAGFLADRRRFVFGANHSGRHRFGLDRRRFARADRSRRPCRGATSCPLAQSRRRGQGHLLFIRESGLFAMGIDGGFGADRRRAAASGPVGFSLSSGAALSPFSVQDDVLGYVSSANSASRLVWVNRQGQILGPAATSAGFSRDVRISPDGSLATVSRFNDARSVYDLMLLDFASPDHVAIDVRHHRLPGLVAAAISRRSSLRTCRRRVRCSSGWRREKARRRSTVVPPGKTSCFCPTSPDGRHPVSKQSRPDGNADLYAARAGEARPKNDSFLSTPVYEESRASHQTASGSPISPTKRGRRRSYVRSFPAGDKNSRFRAVGPFGASGGGTAKNCSTCRPMAT